MSRLWTPLWLAVIGLSPANAADSLRDGDIIFHTSRSAQSQAVQPSPLLKTLAP
jgi:hypothetical protein